MDSRCECDTISKIFCSSHKRTNPDVGDRRDSGSGTGGGGVAVVFIIENAQTTLAKVHPSSCNLRSRRRVVNIVPNSSLGALRKERYKTGTTTFSNLNNKISSTFSLPLTTLLIFMSLVMDNIPWIVGAPLRPPYISTSSVQHYLLKFGYLPQSGFEIRDQVTEQRMQEAVRELQAFANLTVTGVIDEETRKLIQRPRCGVPDILTGQFMSENHQFRSRRRRFIIQGQKWPTTSLTWSVKRASPAHDENDIIEELTRAISVWSRSTPLRFSRLTADRADEADIRIVFSKGYHEDGYPFDGKGSILAHAFFPGNGQGGDAHFDDDEIWIINGKSQNGEGTRLFSVAAHEFGHSLGLSHSDVEGALMYPWYQNFDYNLRLSRDDELGIQRIYGSMSKWAHNPYRPDYPDGDSKPTFRPRTTPTRRGKTYHPADGRPSNCDSSYDAISLIRDELFIFKGRYFWRVNSTPNDNRLLKGYPSLITNMWQKLPPNLTHVDAVYEHNEVEIVFFIGRYYWRFQGTSLLYGYPKTLSSMGISPDVEKIDGAMIWGHNKKTYLFSGTQYWRLQDTDPQVFRVEPDYPRDMYVWHGVPTNIDSVLRWKDGNSYFFKEKVFWKFNDKHMRVDSENPTLSAPFWMGCTSNPIVPPGKNPIKDGSTSTGIASPSISTLRITVIVLTFSHLSHFLLPLG